MKKSKDFIVKMRKKLIEKELEFTDRLKSQAEDRVFEGQVKDTADEAFSSSMEKIQNSLEQSEIDEIKLIEQAIGRIDKGEYGLCIDCRESISDKRLENYPYAARCIVCQEALES